MNHLKLPLRDILRLLETCGSDLYLANAVAEEGNIDRFRRYLAYGADEAPYGSALEFLPLCGVIGLGRILSEGRMDLLDEITKGILLEDERKIDEFAALRKASGFCWSVAVVASPDAGKNEMENGFSIKIKILSGL